MNDREIRVLTTRLPVAEYAALRGYAHLADRSMNDVVVEAVRRFLTEHVANEDLDAKIAAAGEQVRAFARARRSR